jgi:CBS-domain-containing membrane protein
MLHRVSGLPVVKVGREVAGVVTEADLLAAQAATARRLHSASRQTLWQRDRHPALTAGELMPAPAITIRPNATIPAAARLMNTHHVRRLPVVDEQGRIVGIVNRRDLLSVFLRPDEDIAADIRRVLDGVIAAAPREADAAVRNGIVTLTGTLGPKTGPHGDLIPLAIQRREDQSCRPGFHRPPCFLQHGLVACCSPPDTSTRVRVRRPDQLVDGLLGSKCRVISCWQPAAARRRHARHSDTTFPEALSRPAEE